MSLLQTPGDLASRFASAANCCVDSPGTVSANPCGSLPTNAGFSGQPGRSVFAHMLQHVVNHATYHRGQLTTMFRELGATPRALDFLVYFDETAEARG